MDAFGEEKKDKKDGGSKKPPASSSAPKAEAQDSGAGGGMSAFGGGGGESAPAPEPEGDGGMMGGGAPPVTPTSNGPQAGFEGGQMATPGPVDGNQGMVEQNEGIFSIFQEMEQGATGSMDFLTTLASQFPGASEPIRRALEGLQMFQMSLLDVIQAVTVEAAQPAVMSPRSSF